MGTVAISLPPSDWLKLAHLVGEGQQASLGKHLHEVSRLKNCAREVGT